MDVSTRKSNLGFTLLEMVIVILIIGILSLVVINQLPSASIDLGALAQEIVSSVRYTQALSMYTGQRYYFYAPSTGSYEIVNGSSTPIVLAQGNTVVTFPTGVTFGATTFPNGMVGFNGRGQPITDTTGTLLTTTGTFSLTNGTTTMTITVQANTGAVTLS
jgi:prepilin-type N-terminal cleavage/methylation domain-containing protein